MTLFHLASQRRSARQAEGTLKALSLFIALLEAGPREGWRRGAERGPAAAAPGWAASCCDGGEGGRDESCRAGLLRPRGSVLLLETAFPSTFCCFFWKPLNPFPPCSSETHIFFIIIFSIQGKCWCSAPAGEKKCWSLAPAAPCSPCPDQRLAPSTWAQGELASSTREATARFCCWGSEGGAWIGQSEKSGQIGSEAEPCQSHFKKALEEPLAVFSLSYPFGVG